MRQESRRRAAFLQEMGVGAIWVRRDADADFDLPVRTQSGADAAALPAVQPGAVSPAPAGGASAGADAAWDESPSAKTMRRLTTDPATLPSAAETAAMDWQQLQAAVAACRGCDLCQGRSRTVFGSGDRQATWLFVGEGPGHTEDLQGEPFMGSAGKLLDSMLSAMGLKRDVDVYLANIVKCRSTDANGADHAPSQQQIASCKPYLERQIALLQPAVIVALGKTAALALLGCEVDTHLSSLRGRLHRVNQTPTVVTYHPAHLLRNPMAKRETWDDLCLALGAYVNQTADRNAE
ncbi:uracil-DNA glycosylase family protein [Herminiimonas sp. CN]|uniref:uracil-DNA glycosylase n=1 Tax=Herminiimonas sp. CN TaxID=1349818 RepID=UPI000473B0B7|nr:uracil-DNA glycosylase [Herminiimonas sp. CN]